MRVTPQIIGSYVDSVAGKTRTVSSVTKRLIGEVVELGLSAGLSAGEIFTAVTDSLQSQALKASHRDQRVHLISTLAGDPLELAEECADVGLILKDLCYVGKIDLELEEETKLEKFSKKTLIVAEDGTISSAKRHLGEK